MTDEQMNTIMQAIKELSDNQKQTNDRLTRIEEKLEFVQYKLIEHDEQIYTLRKKA
ncbi:tetrahydromethanopterin S-methyltransferase subunit G [Alkalibacillus flavidus]|uniref:Tetrahydromethanopterin S-methyltransferase subunit G n=1 Tax=Alkalibacillus flavidus TaxID=546021 RepID=A0ABV2KVA1_9BACI